MRKAKADQIPVISSNSKQRNLSPRVSKAVRDFWRGFVEQTLNTEKNENDERTPLPGKVVNIQPGAYRIIPGNNQEKDVTLLDSGYFISDMSEETVEKFIVTQLGNSVYDISSVKSGNAIMDQSDFKWKFITAGGGAYRIVNQSDQALLVKEDNTLDLGPVNEPEKGMDTQTWFLSKVDVTELEQIAMKLMKHHVTLTNHDNSSAVLCVAGNAIDDGSLLVLSMPEYANSQYFNFTQNEDGSYKIVNENAGKNVSLVKGNMVGISEQGDAYWTLQQAESGWFYIMDNNNKYLTINTEDMTIRLSDGESTAGEWGIYFP